MKIIIKSPTKAYLDSYYQHEHDLLHDLLSYKNIAAQHQLKRLSKNFYFRNSNPVKWEQQCASLKAQINQTLIFQDEQGQYIRPGSIPYLEGLDLEIENKIQYPRPKKVFWFHPLPFKLYPYQEESVKKLIEIKHGNVELCTSSGKSACILKLCQELGLKTAIITPSKAIFKELLERFQFHFGKGKVGAYGDGKKKTEKLFTVCIGDSLVNVEKGSKEWEFFSTLDCIIVDESHGTPAETLEKVCHGLFGNVSYRFFFSGTQTRGDGSIRLLQSIIGKTVHSLTTKEAVRDSFVCPHNFKIIQMELNDPSFTSEDALETKRHLFLRNKNIASFSAKLANAMASKGEQTLILVEELNQIAMLAPLLTVPFGYAHSESSKERLAALGLEKVDVQEQIENFNRNEIKVLIGTSCIHVGCNIFPMRHTINWAGGASEVKTKQAAVGRSIRLASANPYKNLCGEKPFVTIYDFDIIGNYILEQHLIKRLEYYRDSGENLIKYIKMK